METPESWPWSRKELWHELSFINTICSLLSDQYDLRSDLSSLMWLPGWHTRMVQVRQPKPPFAFLYMTIWKLESFPKTIQIDRFGWKDLCSKLCKMNILNVLVHRCVQQRVCPNNWFEPEWEPQACVWTFPAKQLVAATAVHCGHRADILWWFYSRGVCMYHLISINLKQKSHTVFTH